MLLTEIYEELPLMLSSKKSDSSSTTISVKSEDVEAERNEDKNQESKLIFPMCLVLDLKIEFFFFSKVFPNIR